MWGDTRTYLDWAAAAPVSPRARGVFLAALSAFGNPGSPHTEGRQARAVLEDARLKIARLGQVKADGVVFTSGATEANALALLGAVRAKGTKGAHVLYHPAQHASVIGAVRMLEAEGATVEPYTLDTLKEKLRKDTVLITSDAVNSETGEVFDTRDIRRAIDGAHSGALLHADAAQAPLTRSYELTHLGADLVTLDAQKAGGVRGIGALLVRQGVNLAPLMAGGGQEGGRRPGTPSPALAAAFATALGECEENRKKFTERASAQREGLMKDISGIRDLFVNEGKEQTPNLLNLSLAGRDTDYLVALLDKAGFSVATKSACESDSAEGSRAVLAMTGDAERAQATLRVSWGPSTKNAELTRFAHALVMQVRFLDENPI